MTTPYWITHTAVNIHNHAICYTSYSFCVFKYYGDDNWNETLSLINIEIEPSKTGSFIIWLKIIFIFDKMNDYINYQDVTDIYTQAGISGINME